MERRYDLSPSWSNHLTLNPGFACFPTKVPSREMVLPPQPPKPCRITPAGVRERFIIRGHCPQSATQNRLRVPSLPFSSGNRFSGCFKAPATSASPLFISCSQKDFHYVIPATPFPCRLRQISTAEYGPPPPPQVLF